MKLTHIFASVAGIMSDARVLIERVQVLAQQNRITYDSPIEPELVIKEIANVQQFTIMVAEDRSGFQLWLLELTRINQNYL
jgi:20S proteasome alpha/beta subunit